MNMRRGWIILRDLEVLNKFFFFFFFEKQTHTHNDEKKDFIIKTYHNFTKKSWLIIILVNKLFLKIIIILVNKLFLKSFYITFTINIKNCQNN